MKADIEVTCEIRSYEGPVVYFVTTGSMLFEALQKRCPTQVNLSHIRDAVEARLSDLRRAMETATTCHLLDDRWQETQFAILSLFESGKASIRQPDGYLLRISELSSQDWMTGEDLCAAGGKRYLTRDGQEVLRTQEWIS